jgi:hypothetical protein
MRVQLELPDDARPALERDDRVTVVEQVSGTGPAGVGRGRA